ncbi:DUF4365 domain-containing protein [Myxococcus sp. AM011]|uniref:DUF4365 domain-containing protein n=1 Tax=Myxococcus sp. AM011 TaxID=2745200 RepID=UPI001594EDFA|nr:DUF4365 domain-containing protein [Myxococcus sp. AM011]
MPIRPRAHQLEDESIGALKSALEGVGWVVERLHKDYGEDLFVRIFKEGRPTPLSFFVQVKASDAPSLNRKRQCFVVRVGVEHLRHWNGFWEPLFLMLYDARSGEIYWEEIHCFARTDTGQRALARGGKTVGVDVSVDNKLERDGLVRIAGIAAGMFGRHSASMEAVSLMTELLAEEGMVLIDPFRPEVACMIFEKEGSRRVYVLGPLGERLRMASRRSRESPDAHFDRIIREGLGSTRYGKKFVMVRNPKTGVFERKSRLRHERDMRKLREMSSAHEIGLGDVSFRRRKS